VTRVPEPIVNELREKWESFYVDSRPENQRRHAQRAQSVDPMAISTRATQLMAEARKKSRTIAVRDAILAATDELTADFETAMRRKYGDLIIDILGIPAVADIPR
jgi:fructosamine-3-kinase